MEVIAITLLAVMAFAKGWEDIELYGKTKKAWLKRFLPLKQGIPKHDVYRRVFNRLNPRDIERCFMAWVRAIKQEKEREVIAIDGKTLRGALIPSRGVRPSTWSAPGQRKTGWCLPR
ncbi:MAG: ISAs1 family transposase [Treponema sp.]|nr:ISAs1 family transposase [Treponema sp.]